MAVEVAGNAVGRARGMTSQASRDMLVMAVAAEEGIDEDAARRSSISTMNNPLGLKAVVERASV